MGRGSSGTPSVTWPIVGTDVQIGADIPCETMRHSFVEKTDFGIGYGSTPATTTKIIHVFTGAGTVQGFHALCAASGSSASVTFDLKKNGTTVLSAPITITNATGNGVKVDGALAGVTTCAAGDILTAVLTVSSSTGMQGPFCWVTVQETVSPV